MGRSGIVRSCLSTSRTTIAISRVLAAIVKNVQIGKVFLEEDATDIMTRVGMTSIVVEECRCESLVNVSSTRFFASFRAASAP